MLIKFLIAVVIINALAHLGQVFILYRKKNSRGLGVFVFALVNFTIAWLLLQYPDYGLLGAIICSATGGCGVLLYSKVSAGNPWLDRVILLCDGLSIFLVGYILLFKLL